VIEDHLLQVHLHLLHLAEDDAAFALNLLQATMMTVLVFIPGVDFTHIFRGIFIKVS
jgi:hypothetical protein